MRFRYSMRKKVELFANIGDPDQMSCSAASDLGMQCLPITLLGVSRLQWVKIIIQKQRKKTIIFNPSSDGHGYALHLKMVQIQISWLLQKPTDLGLHCLSFRI